MKLTLLKKHLNFTTQRFSEFRRRGRHLALTCSMIFALFTVTGFGQLVDSYGNEFWIAFPENFDVTEENTHLQLFIAAKQSSAVQIDIEQIGFSLDTIVGANEIITVAIPLSAMLNAINTVQTKGIHVMSDNEIIIYGLNQRDFSTDAYVAIPIDALGNEHYVMAYSSPGSTARSQFALVATVDNTVVTILSPAELGSNSANIPFTVTLNEGETVQYRGTTGQDVTGTHIVSTAPIGVFGSNLCANVTPNISYCDHLVEMVPSIDKWGQNFVTAPFAGRENGDIYRVMASTENTVVSVNGVNSTLATPGNFYEFNLDIPSYITADKPVLIAQYMQGNLADNDDLNGDPSMTILTPTEQFLGDYIISTPATGFVTHHINLVIPTGSISSLVLDGLPISVSLFTEVAGSGHSIAQVPVSEGVHALSASAAFGVAIYGTNNDDSYAYTGGQVYSEIAQEINLVLTPDNSSGPIFQEQCLQASLQNTTSGAPVQGTRVDFTVDGVNTTSGFAFTNADGIATFCYTSESIGVDNVTASQGSLNESVVVTWLNFECPDLEANIGDACNDGDDMTENDIITEGCECVGTPINPELDCPDLSANIGDTCDDGNDMTENDMITVDCECVGTPIAVWECPGLSANIGDTCDDGNDMTENDMITVDCECVGTPITAWECPDLSANIGDACNDGDDMTENDVITEDCQCAGTPIVIEYDCPNLEANIGDACILDGGGMGVITADCGCKPVVIPTCQNFVYYLSDHSAADGVSDIYKVTLSGGVATMDYIATSDIEVHIAYHGVTNLIYAVSKHNNSYRTLDPTTAIWGFEESLGGDYGEITTAVFNHDGKLLLGSQTHKKIYSVNVTTHMVSATPYDTYAPISGGDLAYASDGMLFMATRSGNGLYEVWSAPINDNLIGFVPTKVTGLAITDSDQLLVSAQGQSSLVVRNYDGSDPLMSYNLMLNGNPYTLRDGDMASGCNTKSTDEGDCDDFSTFYVNHGPGIAGSNLYRVNFSGDNANLTLETNVNFEAHIGFDAVNKMLYFVNADGSSMTLYKVLSPTPGDGTFIATIDLSGPVLPKITAVVYNPTDPGYLYVGEDITTAIYKIDVNTGVATYIDDAPVSGGDIAILNDGTIYLATRQGNALYSVSPLNFVGSIGAAVTGIARANDFSSSLILSNKGSRKFTKVSAIDASVIRTYDIWLDGSPFTLSNGDMAAGCADQTIPEPKAADNQSAENISTLTSYPNPTTGPSKVVFVTGETTRTTVEIYDMNGRNVGILFNQEAQKGEQYTLDFNGSQLPNGVYIYRMTTSNETIIEKFMIAR